jgi:hypothetical protein
VKSCPVLDALKRLALLIDEEAKGKIGRWEYFRQINELREEIDNTVLENCKIQQGG